jgi:hypothetical protein
MRKTKSPFERKTASWWKILQIRVRVGDMVYVSGTVQELYLAGLIAGPSRPEPWPALSVDVFEVKL